MAYPSIVSALEGVSFPISKNDLMSQVGDREIEVLQTVEGKPAQMMPMSELLNACTKDMYNDAHDVIACPEIVQKIESTKLKAA